MPKIPECDRFLYYTNDYHLLCAAHPYGSDTDTCPDFSPNPELEGKRFVDFLGLLQQSGVNLDSSKSLINPFDLPFNLEPDEEQWEPEGASYYNGELILQPQQRWTREEQLELLDWHPLFTGKCPQCKYQFDRDYTVRVHWDCPECSWIDDTV